MKPLPPEVRAWLDDLAARRRLVDVMLLRDSGIERNGPVYRVEMNHAAAEDVRLDLEQAQRDGGQMLRQALEQHRAALLGEDKETN